MRIPRLAIMTMGLGLSAAVPAGAASFDCTAGLTHTEAAICDNGDLSNLDSRMAAVYTAIMRRAPFAFRKQVQHDQIVWLQARDACGANTDCLWNAYTARIQILQSYGY
jgi:uncharacterized protein